MSVFSDMGEIDNGNLNRYYNDVVKMDRNDTKERVEDVMPIVTAILAEINRRDPRFGKQAECMGSYWQGLKIEKADEFDINVEIKGFPDLVPCPFEQKYIGFNKKVEDPVPTMDETLQIVRSSTPLPRSQPGYEYIYIRGYDKYGMGEWIVDGVMIPFLVKRTFHHLLTDTIRDLGLRGAVRQKKLVPGPALTIRVMDAAGRITADVDFVPTATAVQDFPSNWPSPHVQWPSTEKIRAVKEKRLSRAPKKNFCWSFAYARADHELCQNLDADGGCRKQCLRMMKKMKSEIWCPTSKPVITSTHLKNTIFWDCQDNPHSWNIERLSQHYMRLVRRLHGYVKDRRLPMYFNPDVNLLAKKDEGEMSLVERKLEEFLRNPSYFLRKALSG